MIDSCCPKALQVTLSFPLFMYSIPVALLYDIYTLLISSRQSIKFVELTNLHGAYFAFSLLVYFFKDYLGDIMCNNVPNSVSGHTFYHVFYFTLRLVAYLSTGKHKPFFYRLYFFVNQSLNIINLSITYLGGFHTLRQMFYGAFIGVFVVILFLVVKNCFSRKSNLKFYILTMIVCLFIAETSTTIKPSYILFIQPSITWFAFCGLAYMVESREQGKLE